MGDMNAYNFFEASYFGIAREPFKSCYVLSHVTVATFCYFLLL